MNSSKAKHLLLELAKKLDVTVFKSTNTTMEIHLDAPNGFCFESELHMLVCSDWEDAYQRLKSYGKVEKCETEECDVCVAVENTDIAMTAEQYAAWMGWELIYASEKFR